MYRQFNIQQFHVLPTHCIYVFCVDLRTNSDYFPIQHQLTGFYNQVVVCLLCGMDWIFIHNSGLSRSHISLCEICGGQGGTVTCFSPITSVCFCHYLSTIAPTRRTNKPNLGTFHKVLLFRKSWGTE